MIKEYCKCKYLISPKVRLKGSFLIFHLSFLIYHKGYKLTEFFFFNELRVNI